MCKNQASRRDRRKNIYIQSNILLKACASQQIAASPLAHSCFLPMALYSASSPPCNPWALGVTGKRVLLLVYAQRGAGIIRIRYCSLSRLWYLLVITGHYRVQHVNPQSDRLCGARARAQLARNLGPEELTRHAFLTFCPIGPSSAKAPAKLLHVCRCYLMSPLWHVRPMSGTGHHPSAADRRAAPPRR